ncbi:MAG: nickel-dependent lactate racemase, partial [Desulfosarcina sp.]
MQVRMNYGRQGLALTLPDDWKATVIRKKVMPWIQDASVAIAQALGNPVGSPPLAELAEPGRKACILICDITRPVPNHLFLRPLIEELIRGGVALADVTVLVATGLHRPNKGAELRELVGDTWVLEHVHIENHLARDDEAHLAVGTTRRGTVVRLDRRFAAADIRIATGLVEPHFMAGYSGGRKVITPGVAHAETITRLHTATYMEDPKAANCILAGNPLHREQLEIVGMLGGALALNTVIDEKRRLSFVNFGEIEASHAQAVAFVRPYAEVFLEQPFSTVLTSAAGYPLDKTYYQTVKGMVGGMEILSPGGNLFVVSEISEGMGSPEYVKAQEKLIQLGSEGFLADILPKRHAAIDEWQTEMQLKPMRKGQVHLYTTG